MMEEILGVVEAHHTEDVGVAALSVVASVKTGVYFKIDVSEKICNESVFVEF